ncbi:MAG: chorion class high-cysteine HCB protein 13 [Anaerotignum sp.]|nr:chorion class high-cysteine HCB protein 13 [Anaerotignum sp.]
MCGFGCGNDNGFIWIIILLFLCGCNNGCDNDWGNGSSWIWILILLCCCGNNNHIGNNCSTC